MHTCCASFLLTYEVLRLSTCELMRKLFESFPLRRCKCVCFVQLAKLVPLKLILLVRLPTRNIHHISISWTSTFTSLIRFMHVTRCLAKCICVKPALV